ncbi:MAG: phytoene desaturase family protein, partial [Chloroflexota bacterium]
MSALRSSQKRVLVLGAGVGGLASAALLAKEGYDVTVIEKNEQPGGRASLLERDGFRFDMGPSWYLMPDVYERFFQQMGATTADYLKLTHLSPHYRIFYADGQSVDITGDLERDKALFEQIEPGSAAQFDRYLAESKTKYDVSIRSILYKNITLCDFMSKELRDSGRDLHVFRSMQNYVASFFKTEKLQQIIQYTLVFLGGIPKNTPALYSLMSHIDFNLGVFYPDGGIHAVINALVALGEQHGVKYIYNQPVTSIDAHEGRVTSVHCGDTMYAADWVISNADYRHTETLLSDPTKRQYSERYWQQRTLAPSAFIMYLGVKGELPQLAHHNLLFSPDWDGHFRELSTAPAWPHMPSLYICVPSKTDSHVAPPGYENLFVLVPVAAGLTETEESRQQYADSMLDYIERSLGLALRDRLVVKEIFSVSDFATRYNSLRGTALGLAHTIWQSALFRPANKSRRLPNLFFVGANTTPGIGVPMCLISAHN